jgi:hypothetical protein
MKWSCRPPTGPQPYTKWFAWHPVDRVAPDRPNDWVWLEWVERRVVYPFEGTTAWAEFVYRRLP